MLLDTAFRTRFFCAATPNGGRICWHPTVCSSTESGPLANVRTPVADVVETVNTPDDARELSRYFGIFLRHILLKHRLYDLHLESFIDLCDRAGEADVILIRAV